VQLVAICDLDEDKAKALADTYGVSRVYDSMLALLENEALDLVDIITPPSTHLELCTLAAEHGKAIICQKPLAPAYHEAVNLVNSISGRVPFMVHENFRFQPWYRKIKTLLENGDVGDQIHTLYLQTRLGDGWQPDAYLQRQPYFRTMPKLLIFETGIHFIDTFRYLLGEVDRVFADLRKLNEEIAGEDCAMVWFKMTSGTRAIWDANRYNESQSENPRYTFGEILLEANGGSIRLYHDGRMTLQKLGQREEEVEYEHRDHGFGGDCVYFTQKHLVDSLLNKIECETDGKKYLQNLRIQEAIYESARSKQVVQI
jgi:predicted dehydrogenase